MITDLRARIRAAAEKPKPEPKQAACLSVDSSTPLSGYPGLPGVTAPQLRPLGLAFPAWDASRALFLDTETTGLRGAGTVAFLIGLGWIEGDSFVVRQLLMRDYPEEIDLLETLSALLPRFTSIVSFNGKSFDVPLLCDRFTMARLRARLSDLPHLDLLHAARRTWKLRLSSCSLSNLEEAVLGIPRENDLPGAEVPERYFAFLKTGDATLLDDVLRHNAQDVRTMALLLARLARIYAAPECQESLLDVFSAGRALDRCGERELARRCYRVASVSELSQRARTALALSYRSDGQYEQAAEAYRSLIARGEGGPDAYAALAVLLERRLKDAAGALAVVEKALWRFSGTSPFCRVEPETIAALEKRRARLKKIMEGKAWRSSRT